MSVYMLVSGTLVGDPVPRTSANGNAFTTATVRAHTEGGDYVLISTIAFGDAAAALLGHRQGDALAVSGRGSIRTWEGKDGSTKAGLSIVAEQVASAASARRADAERRGRGRSAA